MNNSLNLCIGNKIDPIPAKKEYISSRLLIYTPGVIKEIKPVQELIGHNHIIDIILRKKVSEELHRYQTKSDICGWVLCKGNSPEEASQWADKAWETLKEYIIIG